MSGDVNELVEAGDGIEVVYNNDDDVNSEDECNFVRTYSLN